MKRIQAILITQSPKKKNKNEQNKYFNKISRNIISVLLKFFEDKELKILFTLNSKFKKAFCSLKQIDEDENEMKNSIKYWLAINHMKYYSNPFIPYINIFLNLDIFHLEPELLGIKFIKEMNKYFVLKSIVEVHYIQTKQNKFLINIESDEDFKKYFYFINLINIKIKEKLSFIVKFSNKIDIEKNIVDATELFSFITFENVEPFNNKKSLQALIDIQTHFFELSNFKCYHKFVWTKDKKKIEQAEKYFNKFKNTLLGIKSKEQIILCKSNIKSLKEIKVDSFPLENFNYPEIQLIKLKFYYPSSEFNKILLENINFDNLQKISGIVIQKSNIKKYIEKINLLNNLSELFRIEFGPEDDEEEENKNYQKELFTRFFSGISKKHKYNLMEVSTWSYVFTKGIDYEFMLNNFPNLRKIMEDYDCSGLYDQRFEINNIFSCNAEGKFNNNDLIALSEILKNYIHQKKPGKNSIKFDLYNNVERLIQLINFLNEKNEKEILDSIDYIYFDISTCDKIEISLNGLKRLNYINFDKENSDLFKLLKNTESINQIKICLENSIIHDNISFFLNKNILSIVWGTERISEEEIKKICQKERLEYFVADESIISYINKIYCRERNKKLKFIPKKYLIE